MKVIEIGKRAQGKLSLDVGFQIRDCPPFVEMVKRIHNGALGTIVCGEAHYLTGYLDRPARPNASPLELRLRNWVYDRALSGDIIVEQNIHVIDICNWILQGHPLKVSASGGRKGRPPADGDVFGNYHAVFHYPNDVDVTFSSTQFAKGWWDVTERFFGTKGTSQSPYAGPLGIWGDDPWQWSGSGANTADPQASRPRESSPRILSWRIRKRRKRSSKASPAGIFTIRRKRVLNPPFPASWLVRQPTRNMKSVGTTS